MMQTEGITKGFGALQVLKGIDLTINKDEVAAIISPSGVGKTALLQITGMLDAPDNGRLVINGMETRRLGDKELAVFRNRNIGFVFQFHQLLPEFTALEDVMTLAPIIKEKSTIVEKWVKEMPDSLRFSNRTARKSAELSGGEKQRVTVTRAFINSPVVILANELSGSFDTKNKEELHALFFELRDQMNQAFIIVIRNEQPATNTDRVTHIKDGMVGAN